jgi:V/A-type H+/Na+-transporting ATPase subunit I
MTEKMRKISLLVYYKERQQILSALQDLGVLHLETTDVINEKVDNLTDERNKYPKAIEILKSISGDDVYKAKPISNINTDVAGKRDDILTIQDKIEKAAAKIEGYKKDKAHLQPWGDFNWKNIKRLHERGFNIRFFSGPKKEYQSYDFGDVHHFIISESKSTVYFIVVEKTDERNEVPFDLMHLPQRSMQELDEAILLKQREIEELSQQLVAYNPYVKAFEEEVAIIEDHLQYEIANLSFSTHAEGNILHISGWFPARIEPDVRKCLDENNVSYIIEKPTRQDQIPIILRNREYAKRFEPITKMFQLPNFYEFDLTPVIAVFYPIFFAYCLGDSGYGMILLTLGLIARYTFLKNTRIVADLIIILGIVATILGIIKAGTLFGLNIADHQDIPIFGWLANFIIIPDDTSYVFNTFNVALMIGLLQIIVAVCIAIYRKIKFQSFIYSVSTFGKLFIIIGAVTLFLGGMQEVEVFIPYLSVAWSLMIGGIFLVLAFHNPDIPAAQRIGGGFLPVYFIFTGLLGDVLSYIRLFALGVASTILGIVVNDIGNQIMAGGGVGWIAGGAVFLLFGHSLNLAIATLGSFVHPLRLTFVEFYNNAEFKGGGIEFKPFKKQILQLNKI